MTIIKTHTKFIKNNELTISLIIDGKGRRPVERRDGEPPSFTNTFGGVE